MTPEQTRRGEDCARERRGRRRGIECYAVHQIVRPGRSPHRAPKPDLTGVSRRQTLHNRGMRTQRRTLKGDFSMRIRKLLLVGGGKCGRRTGARLRRPSPDAQAITGTVRRTARARSRPSPGRSRTLSASTAARRSSSASRARAAASSASARARPTCPTPPGRSGCPRRQKCHADGIGVHPVPGRERRHLARRQQGRNVGQLPHDRRSSRRSGTSGSKVNNWNDVRAGFPNVPLKLFGPGTDSGTFEFFTEKINGKARQAGRTTRPPRTTTCSCAASRVSAERSGYFGLSYYLENKSRLKVLRSTPVTAA